jgi:CBS domain containing-hemolysin-like protein
MWILFAVALVALNGFFVAAEFALVKVRPTRLNQLVRERRPFAKSAQWLWKRMDRALSACQLGITIASLGLGWVGEPAIARLLEPALHAAGITSQATIHGISFTVAFTLITAAHLVLGEQAPKIFAIRRPEPVAMWSAGPMRMFYVISYPLLTSLDAATRFVLSWFGVKSAGEHDMPHSEEEIRMLLGHARSHGELTGLEHTLVEAVFEFDDTVCRQIMIPRHEVVFLDTRAPFAESLAVVMRTKHSRYPLCEGSLDKVLGIVHTRDLVGIDPDSDFDVLTVARPPRYVPATVRLSTLLSRFRATKQHAALVVDEFGTVAGVVTLENVLEEIVGPVQDEFDMESPGVIPDGGQRWVLLGSTPVPKLAELLGTDLPAEGIDTLAGLVALRLGRIPVQGDKIDLGTATLEVLDASHNRATRVRLEKRSEDEET